MTVKQELGTGLTTSAIGYGAMGLAEVYGPVDEADALATLHHVVDSGIDLIDTADVYGAGSNERLIGRLLADRRAEVTLATKFGIVTSAGDYDDHARPQRPRLRRRGLRRQPGPSRHRRDRPLLPPPPRGRSADRGCRRRDGRPRGGGQGAPPGPLRGHRRRAAGRPRRPPDHRSPERVVAVEPRRRASSGSRGRRARCRLRALRAAGARVPDRFDHRRHGPERRLAGRAAPLQRQRPRRRTWPWSRSSAASPAT